MVNTLSGSVSAYRKEIVKPRFIRIDEVMALLDVTRDEAMDIALAAGARYQLAKIILVHKEVPLMDSGYHLRMQSQNILQVCYFWKQIRYSTSVMMEFTRQAAQTITSFDVTDK